MQTDTIGGKLKNARTNANMTQESVAETLGISCQTLSNWENEVPIVKDTT